ncbi:MAG: DUF6198 family protein [Ruminococcus sp.]|nr:DUF6198 family protein [Ruminococcus sp.]
MKKIKLSSETVYLLAILLISFAVAMISSTNFGISMIVAPAYIISEKISFLSFGQSEYVVQGILFIVFCILMKKVKLVYFSSFLTGVIYGAILDAWRIIIPHFNPDVTVPGALPFALKIVYFVLGMLMTSLAIALFFRTYIYPQVYDFFVKGITEHFKLNQTKFKMCFDVTFLLISCVLTLVLFRRFVGIGVGTLIMTCLNGILIGGFGKLIDKFFEITPRFPKFAAKFDL